MGSLAPLLCRTQTQLTRTVTTLGSRPMALSHPSVLAHGLFTLDDPLGSLQTCKSCALWHPVVLFLTRKAEVKLKGPLTTTPKATTLPALPSRRQRRCTACSSHSRPRIPSPNQSPPRGPINCHLNLPPPRLLPGRAQAERRDATHALSSSFHWTSPFLTSPATSAGGLHGQPSVLACTLECKCFIIIRTECV